MKFSLKIKELDEEKHVKRQFEKETKIVFSQRAQPPQSISRNLPGHIHTEDAFKMI